MLCIPELPGTRIVAISSGNGVMVVLSQARTATSATRKFESSKWKTQVVKFIIMWYTYRL